MKYVQSLLLRIVRHAIALCRRTENAVELKVARMSPNLTGGVRAVNTGSNPAMYAFRYEDDGINLAIGRSGLDMDLLLLRKNRNILKRDTIVLVPIAPLYSILGEAEQSMKKQDRDKYEEYYGVKSYVPNKYAIQLIFDREYEEDAQRRVEAWKEEFEIVDYEDKLTLKNAERREQSVCHINELINYCEECGYKPVLIILPMTKHLLSRMSSTFRETYLYSFVRPITEQRGIKLLDYFEDSRFTKDRYFYDSLFLNTKGAELFTKQVMKDIQI